MLRDHAWWPVMPASWTWEPVVPWAFVVVLSKGAGGRRPRCGAVASWVLVAAAHGGSGAAVDAGSHTSVAVVGSAPWRARWSAGGGLVATRPTPAGGTAHGQGTTSFSGR